MNINPTVQITRMEYRRYGEKLEHTGVKVTFITPSSETKTQMFGDNAYTLQNQHLSLMAAFGHKPTDYDGQVLDLSDEDTRAEAVYNDGEWRIATTVFQRGQQALKRADWFPFGDTDDAVEVHVGGKD